MPSLYKRGDSNSWWIAYRQNGVQVCKSTKQKDKGLAEIELRKVEAMLAAHNAGALTKEFYEAISGRAIPNVTLKASLEQWLTEARGAAGDRTVEKYQGLADSITKHFHATESGPLVSSVTRENLQQFLAERRSSVSAGTANNTRKCLAIFFRRCKVNGIIRDNPVEGIKQFKVSREEKRVRRPFTVKELSELYQKAPDDFWRYMVLGGFFTGLRLGDLATMPIGAVDYKARTINLTTRKTGAVMHIPIAPPFYALLKKLKAERKDAKPTDPFWPEHAKRYEETGGSWFSQRFYDLMLIKAGLVAVRPHRQGPKSKSGKRRVNEVSFHCFRHSYVSTLAALGQNQQIVKALSGHSSDEINDLYTKLPAEVLKPAIALLPDITKAGVSK
jgi:integrase